MLLNLDYPMRTLGGHPVRVVCTDRRDPSKPLVALALKGDYEEVICCDRAGQAVDPAPEWDGEHPAENPHNIVNDFSRHARHHGRVPERVLAPGAHPDRRLINIHKALRTRGPTRSGAGHPVRIVCSDRIGDKPLVALYNDGSGEGVLTARLDGSVWSRSLADSDPGPGALDIVEVEGGTGERQRLLFRAEFEVLLDPGQSTAMGQSALHDLLERHLRENMSAALLEAGRYSRGGPRVVEVAAVGWDNAA